MTSNDLKSVADSYVKVTGDKKALDVELKTMKETIVGELSLVNDVKFDFGNGLKAAKQERKGSVDMKALQIKYNISDSDLDALRKAATTSWVLTVR